MVLCKIKTTNGSKQAGKEGKGEETFHFMDFRSSNQISLKLFIMENIFSEHV